MFNGSFSHRWKTNVGYRDSLTSDQTSVHELQFKGMPFLCCFLVLGKVLTILDDRSCSM